MVPAHPLTARLAALALAVAAVLTGLVGCGDDDEGDLRAFCRAVERLRADDPFGDLPVASPQEMRAAFEELQARAEVIGDEAPPGAEVQADRYRDAVDALVDQLRGAGFDPTQLDTLAYSRATADYGEAATSLDNAADSLCR